MRTAIYTHKLSMTIRATGLHRDSVLATAGQAGRGLGHGESETIVPSLPQ